MFPKPHLFKYYVPKTSLFIYTYLTKTSPIIPKMLLFLLFLIVFQMIKAFFKL